MIIANEIKSTMKSNIIIVLLLLASGMLSAQNTQTGTIKREITLYNPYKPTIPDVVKKSYLPDMTDTARIRPQFVYDVNTYPFMPPYNVSPLKPASLLPDILPRLYKSYVNAGFGNYFTPLAEVSISSERSKKRAIGFYAKHFSTNGKVELQNSEKAFAGYMDNDVSLYGRKFNRKSVLSGSIDFAQRSRYAYGYDTTFTDYDPEKSDIKYKYYNIGSTIGINSTDVDSSTLSYDIRLAYNLFMSGNNFRQHSFGLAGELDRTIGSFYAGAGFEIDYMRPSDTISTTSKYHAMLNPFIRKSTQAWNVQLGMRMILDRRLNVDAGFHIYPDIRFGFNIVPSYLGFFASLTGDMEKNEPFRMVGINPYLLPGNTLYNLPNTNYAMIVKAGITGETGIDGIYELSASYSIVNDFLLFSNYALTDGTEIIERGNHFIPLTDEAEILNVHGETGGKINDKISFETGANLWRYTLTDNNYAWNKPAWDGFLKVKYNLRDKIFARAGMNLVGKRKLLVTSEELSPLSVTSEEVIDAPMHLNFNLSGEYRYTKILSFWFRFDNIAFKDYYEWAYYPSQRFMFMLGFTYSL